jgi:serine O-acetyltransferase
MLSISIWDLMLVWCFPPFLLVVIYLVFIFGIYLLILSPAKFDFKRDVLHKLEAKEKLPSGRNLRLTYPYLLALFSLDNGVQATFLYRLARWLAQHRLRAFASILHSLMKFLTHIDVSPYAEIGPGITFYHGEGIVIGKLTRLGRRVTVCQGATTGSGRPQVGDDVYIGAGAKILGTVTIGSRSKIGANAVVLNDIPEDGIAVGVPAHSVVQNQLSSHEV